MKEIKLNLGKVALVDDEDFEYLNQWKWFVIPGKYTSYARRNGRKTEEKRFYQMHRVILNITDSHVLADHKDRNGLNNQRSNLRLSNKSLNSANAHKKTNSSKYFGVSKHSVNRKNPWIVVITKDNKLNWIGAFPTQEQAALAYNIAVVKLYGEHARLNEISEL